MILFGDLTDICRLEIWDADKGKPKKVKTYDFEEPFNPFFDEEFEVNDLFEQHKDCFYSANRIFR